MSYTIKSLKTKYPTNPQRKRPFSHIMVWWIYNAYYDAANPNFTYLAVIIAILICYFLGTRPNECVWSYHSKSTAYYRQIQFLPSKKEPKELVFHLTKSKTNPGDRLELLSIECHCQKMRFGLPSPCLVHLLKRYLKLRKKKFGKIKKDDELLITELGRKLKYCHLNDFLHKSIIKMSEATKVPLSPFFYTPHSLRTGGTTDLARLGRNALFIQQFGRWQSDEWKKVYIQLDFRDLAALRGETISFIRNSMKHSIE